VKKSFRRPSAEIEVRSLLTRGVVTFRYDDEINSFKFFGHLSTSMLNRRRYAILADVSNGVPLTYTGKYGKSHSRNAVTASPDRTELLLERRDKQRAGHPADYASLSRYLPPQKIYSPPPPSPPPPVFATVGRRRARRHGGTARSGP